MRAFNFILVGQFCASAFAVTVPTTAERIVARIDQPDQTEWPGLIFVDDSKGSVATTVGPNPQVFGLGTLFAVKLWDNASAKKYKPFFQLFQFVKSAFSVATMCSDFGTPWKGVVDCFFATTDFIANFFTGAYEIKETWTPSKVRRDGVSLLDGRPHYGQSTIKRTKDATGQDLHVYSVAHIPHNGTLIRASANAPSAFLDANHTWQHHASVYVNDAKIAHLYHRLAHPEDLGSENNGNIHQYRVQPSDQAPPSDLSNTALLRKRSMSAEKRHDWSQAGGLNTEFIYEHNDDEKLWEVYKGGDKNLGDKWAEKFEYHDTEAGCASPGFCSQYNGVTACSTSMNAVLAYGWNEQPFGWNGRAQGWLDKCSGGCDTFNGGSCTLVGGNGV